MNFVENSFAKEVVKAFLSEYASKDNEKYEFDMDKCDKMNNIIAYCQKLEKENDCKIIRCMLEPKYEQGYVQVLFRGEFVLGESKESLTSFIEAVGQCDGINITTNPVGEEYFQITFFVEDLWKVKS